jgi:hypothetical protein
VVLRVDEAGIADIETGQTGALVVAALPDQSFPISIEKITPVAVYAEGRTTFEVEASLAETTARLRPGMEGAARIDVDTRRRIAIWTAPIIDWLRLWRWRWLGW